MFTIDILFSKWDCCCLYSVNGVRKCVTWVLLIYRYLSSFFYIPWYIHCLIECFHSRGQHLCKFIGTKESVCIRKEFNSHRTRLGHQHGRRFIVLGHQHGRRDVMWKHSIWSKITNPFLDSLKKHAACLKIDKVKKMKLTPGNKGG